MPTMEENRYAPRYINVTLHTKGKTTTTKLTTSRKNLKVTDKGSGIRWL